MRRVARSRATWVAIGTSGSASAASRLMSALASSVLRTRAAATITRGSSGRPGITANSAHTRTSNTRAIASTILADT